MASQTRSPASNASVTGWLTLVNPANAYASDNAYAYVSSNDEDVGHTYHNFGFSIPDGATINGILIELEDKRGAQPGTFPIVLSTVKASSEHGNTTRTGTSISGNPSTSEGYRSYGGESNLWERTWTPAEINSSDFGGKLSGVYTTEMGESDDYSLDHIRITVYYTEGDAPASSNSGFFLVLR
jgi:hypothetical protein